MLLIEYHKSLAFVWSFKKQYFIPSSISCNEFTMDT